MALNPAYLSSAAGSAEEFHADTNQGMTDYHAQYYACELTRRRASDESDKFSSTFYNATVDLNPHQIDAALFAFRNPLSRGESSLMKPLQAKLSSTGRSR